MCDSVLTSRTKARKVEKPPFQTAGPIRVNVALARAVIYTIQTVNKLLGHKQRKYREIRRQHKSTLS